jgi:hypothetical protein
MLIIWKTPQNSNKFQTEILQTSLVIQRKWPGQNFKVDILTRHFLLHGPFFIYTGKYIDMQIVCSTINMFIFN